MCQWMWMQYLSGASMRLLCDPHQEKRMVRYTLRRSEILQADMSTTTAYELASMHEVHCMQHQGNDVAAPKCIRRLRRFPAQVRAPPFVL